jgi:uncharacterized protein (TIGR03437 family)
MSCRIVPLTVLLCCSIPAHAFRPGAIASIAAAAPRLSFVPLNQPSAFLARGAYAARLEPRRVILRGSSGTPLEITLEGANPDAAGVLLDPLPGRENFLIGNRPELWRTGVRAYGRVRYGSVYPGIDLEYYGVGARLECDFIVSPGVSPRSIRFHFRGARSVRRDRGGNLVVKAPGRTLSLGKPHVYQVAPAGKQSVAGEFVVLAGNRAALRLGAYDSGRPLIIDPVIAFSTYLGGSGDENVQAGSDPRIAGIAVDGQGNSYVVGNTASTDFPSGMLPGRGFAGSTDVFVSKFASDGTHIYSTFLGGTGLERGFGVAVDRYGAAYVAGRTQSPNFPLRNAAQTSIASFEDAFILKLDASGSQIVYSSYLGGSGVDFATGIAVDAQGNAWISGDTESANFPVRGNAAQKTHGGGTSDGFAARFGPGGELLYSSFVGGSGFDSCQGVAVDADGSAYLTGFGEPSSFPAAANLGPAAGPAAIRRAFGIKLHSDGSAGYSTMFGGARGEMALAVAADAAGRAYITGVTVSTDFPSSPRAAQPSFGGGSMDGFIAVLTPDGRGLHWATFVGGEGADVPTSIALDSAANVYVTGQTQSARFPLSRAFQPELKGAFDAFVVKVLAGGGSLGYSSFLGGRSNEIGQGIGTGPDGSVWVMGTGDSTDLPTVNPVQAKMGGGLSDAFVVRIEELTIVSAASYQRGSVSPDSIASAFGQDLAPRLESASALPLPTSLAGVSVKIRDSTGVERPAPLFFVAPGQVNFLVPAEAAPGFATITISGSNPVTGGVMITGSAPGLFSANADGRGVGAIVALHVTAAGEQTSEIVYTCSASGCSANPVELGEESAKLILLLFGTGIRGCRELPAVTIGGQPVVVLGAAAQGQYPGLDQVNVVVPRTLAGRGEADIVVNVDGRVANPVKINIR